MRVNELPPLRLHTVAITPTGKTYRWGNDERDPRLIPSGQTSSSTMPGGFETADGALPRKPGIDYADLERLTELRYLGPGEDVAWEGRLERAPATAGDQFVINPSATGWQAHLADDSSASFIPIDRDLTTWRGPSSQRQIDSIGGGFAPTGGGTPTPDPTTGEPALYVGWNGGWNTPKPITDVFYDAGEGNRVGQLRGTWAIIAGINAADSNWVWKALLSSDDILSLFDDSGNLRAAGPDSIELAATAARRYAVLELLYAVTGAVTADNSLFTVAWSDLAVIGDHGLPIYGTDLASQGLLASDIEAYALRRWAPLINFTEGTSGSIRPSQYLIPHLTFRDRTTAGEIIKQAIRFELRDWAIWEKRTYYSNDRDSRGRRWRARITPANLQQTGPQIDQLWNATMVAYRDVDGSPRTVGFPGSGAGVEDAALRDNDPENPANELGIIRCSPPLQAGTLTAGAAIEVGRRFLEAQKVLNTSGKAQIVGHVEDDHGVIHPYWHVRGGDQISFIDAADTSYRRIVNVNQDHDARSASIDLDSPPDGMAALLERLGVAIRS